VIGAPADVRTRRQASSAGALRFTDGSTTFQIPEPEEGSRSLSTARPSLIWESLAWVEEAERGPPPAPSRGHQEEEKGEEMESPAVRAGH